MTRKKKLLLSLLLVIVISQVPFVYRRFKVGRLNAAIQSVNSQRALEPAPSEFSEYQGVLHVHSALGGHSKGSFEEIIAAAKSNQLNFVVMTEHTTGNFNTAAMTLKGTHAGVLFVNGNEVSTSNGDRFLILPGDEATVEQPLPPHELVSKTKARGAMALVAYPQEFKSWDVSELNGVEVYNVYTNTRTINPVVMFFDGLWSYRSYPELLFANFYRRPSADLQKWDEAIRASGRKLVGVAGNDAHSNVGVSLQDSTGKTLVGLQLDPYERSFRLVRVHALIAQAEGLSTESLLKALLAGHCFIGFDLFGDTSGFRYTASTATENRIQGDEIGLTGQVRLEVRTPIASRIVLLKDGNRVDERTGLKMQEFLVNEKGSYRVEVYLPRLPKPVSEQPWIISNPIYVR
ncbi:MAG TPA: hypothetical protein VJU86_20555 [Pyrinomonadaceae bacterium]|nr:hypothetical protein [Pyrinomonadaceae bacterium]